MGNRHDDIRATSEDLTADAHELAALEKRKLDANIEDEELVELSHRAEALAVEIAQKTRLESRLAEETAAAAS
jgi:hypothetical protein